jgi:hypothetical protein
MKRLMGLISLKRAEFSMTDRKFGTLRKSQWTKRKIWGFHGSDYEECRLLGYINPVCTSQETHYNSATNSSRLMLCNIWGFHGSDYEECRLLGYMNPVRASQETHYFSATEHSQLMLCKIEVFTAVTMKNGISGRLCRVALVRTCDLSSGTQLHRVS